MLPDRLVTMANQIGKFFSTQYPSAEHEARAIAGIADHFRRFWDPRMRADIVAFVQHGGEGLDPLPRAAVERLIEETRKA